MLSFSSLNRSLQIGAVVYNLTRSMHEVEPSDEDPIRTRYKAAMDSVIRGNSLDRGSRMAEQGIMVKAAGASQTRGQFTKNKGQPAAKTIKDRELLTDLRHEVNGALEGQENPELLLCVAQVNLDL